MVPGRIFSLAMHPGSEQLVVAAGGKGGSVGLWEVEAGAGPPHGVHCFTPHTRPVCCMSWDETNMNNLVSWSSH